MRLYLLRDETSLGTSVLPGSYVVGQQLNLKVSVTGTSPTTVRGKMWLAGGAEPASWQATGPTPRRPCRFRVASRCDRASAPPRRSRPRFSALTISGWLRPEQWRIRVGLSS
jgi:hypothetical protein